MLMISPTIIRIDLSNKKVKCKNIPAALLRKFMGGKGLAAYYLPIFSHKNFLFFDGTAYVVKIKNKKKLKWRLVNYDLGKITQKWESVQQW